MHNPCCMLIGEKSRAVKKTKHQVQNQPQHQHSDKLDLDKNKLKKMNFMSTCYSMLLFE